MATKQEIKEWLKRQGHNEEWFAEQLNIPYFLYWYASDEEIYPEYWDEFVNLIMRPRKINLFLYQSWEITKKILTEWQLKGTDVANTNDLEEWIPEGYEGNWDLENLPYRILCFSNLCTSNHLWEKYADKGHGVCLVFNCNVSLRCQNGVRYSHIVGFPEDASSYLGRLYPVRYDDFKVQWPVVYKQGEKAGINKTPLSNAIPLGKLEELFTTKDLKWKEEQEERMIVPVEEAIYKDERGNLYFSHMMKYLTGLIIGVNFPREQMDLRQWYQDLRMSDKIKKRQDIKIIYAKKCENGPEIINSEWEDKEYSLMLDYLPIFC